MSDLTELFGGGGPSAAEIAAQEAARKRWAEKKEAEKEAAAKAEALARRTGAIGTARTSATDYLNDLGIDPNMYGTSIDDMINNLMLGVAEDDPNPGVYLQNLGQKVFANEQDVARTRALRDINQTFGQDYELGRIGDTADDAILADINSQQRGDADAYIQNLLRRGVITQTGYEGASRNLDQQGSRVRTQLNDLGNQSLAAGRQRIGDIINRGRSNAQTLSLGSQFDPSQYTGQVDQAFNEIMSGLGDSIKSKVPGQLYDTSGLAAIAGTAQGAQNLPFDPQALAGIVDDEEDDSSDPFNPNAKKKKSSVLF